MKTDWAISSWLRPEDQRVVVQISIDRRYFDPTLQKLPYETFALLLEGAIKTAFDNLKAARPSGSVS